MDETTRRAPHRLPLEGELYPSGQIGITVAGYHVTTIPAPDLGEFETREQIENAINWAVSDWLRGLDQAAQSSTPPELAPGT